MDEKSVLEEALSYFKAENHVTLATVEGTQPRLRTMTIMYWGGGFYFATGSGSNKMLQLGQNPRVEFLLSIRDGQNNGYVRVECSAETVRAQKVIEQLFKSYGFMGKLWSGPNDPKLAVVQLTPSSVDYLRPGDWSSTKTSLSERWSRT